MPASIMSKESISNSISSSDIRDQLPAVLKGLRRGQVFTLTHYNRPVAVILPHELYQALVQEKEERCT
ncbi:MAG: hypothetical protein DRI61_13255 [Chloroflexi bacterium]|nr:MAG: hypothetical protein DRI61_13255 [Chloroflexota bacterium]